MQPLRLLRGRRGAHHLLCVAYLFVAVVLCTDRAPAQCRGRFVRGDVDTDGQFNITDPVRLLDALFRGRIGVPCEDSADTDDDGVLNITDAVLLLDFLFRGGSVVPTPHLACGVDPTADRLGCESFPGCPPVDRDETCDGSDDDCDGEIDEDVDLASDPRNCAECGNDCAARAWPNVRAYACLRGECVIGACENGFLDVDGIAANGCELEIPFNDSPCDDNNPCTTQDRFLAGLCGGTPRDCSAFADVCNYGVCDPDTGECVRVPRPGRACDDGNAETGGDRCNPSGVCAGTPIR